MNLSQLTIFVGLKFERSYIFKMIVFLFALVMYSTQAQSSTNDTLVSSTTILDPKPLRPPIINVTVPPRFIKDPKPIQSPVIPVPKPLFPPTIQPRVINTSFVPLTLTDDTIDPLTYLNKIDYSKLSADARRVFLEKLLQSLPQFEVDTQIADLCTKFLEYIVKFSKVSFAHLRDSDVLRELSQTLFSSNPEFVRINVAEGLPYVPESLKPEVLQALATHFSSSPNTFDLFLWRTFHDHYKKFDHTVDTVNSTATLNLYFDEGKIVRIVVSPDSNVVVFKGFTMKYLPLVAPTFSVGP